MDHEQLEKVGYCMCEKKHMTEREFLYMRGLANADPNYYLTPKQDRYLDLIYSKIRQIKGETKNEC